MKGIFLALVCAFALTSATDDSEIAVNHLGCPIDITIQLSLPHEKYCDRFYVCVVGLPILIECPAQTAFNTDLSVCDHRADVDCGSRTFPDEENISESDEKEEEEVTKRPLFGYDDPSKAPEICAEPGSDSILISHEDCSKYYQCNFGYPAVLNCPSNLYYNPKIGACDWQANVDCQNVGVDNPDWTDAERECNKGLSLVPHKYCDWFYQCGPQGPIAKPCGTGTVFDYAIQTCNWPIFVNCGDRELKPPSVDSEEDKEDVTKPEVEEEVTEREESKEEEEVVEPEEDKEDEEVTERGESKEEEEVAKPEEDKDEDSKEEEEGNVTEEKEEVDDVIIELPEEIS